MELHKYDCNLHEKWTRTAIFSERCISVGTALLTLCLASVSNISSRNDTGFNIVYILCSFTYLTTSRTLIPVFNCFNRLSGRIINRFWQQLESTFSLRTIAALLRQRLAMNEENIAAIR